GNGNTAGPAEKLNTLSATVAMNFSVAACIQINHHPPAYRRYDSTHSVAHTPPENPFRKIFD
ncbi:MAG: hypothetical protein KAT50_05515, partial [Pirellulales bacterium]|nr:hypothetical protein [Pirellulales bacterium]